MGGSEDVGHEFSVEDAVRRGWLYLYSQYHSMVAYSPLATGSFRTPSQINLASLLDSSAGVGRVDMLSAWPILGVSCVMAALF
jgi:hypothetical protein